MAATDDAPFLRAARGEATPHTPVWFMRQAGRSLPEYHEVRGPGSILDAIARPDVAAEITLQPIRRYGVDAAVLYSDIVVPVHAIGFGIDVEPGVGPVCEQPVRSADDLRRLRPLDPGVDLAHVIETISILDRELEVPLLGFAGAPFTLGSYLIEGAPSRTYGHTKAMMMGEPALWHDFMERLTELALSFLDAQIDAGVHAVQLFDSWAGALSRRQYESHVLPYSRRIFGHLRERGVPSVHFGVGTGELLDLLASAGPDMVGIDWRVAIDDARARIGDLAVQGNLDPALCLAPWECVAEGARDVLERNAGRPGHVFNLGHGVLPETDPEILERLVDLVHTWRPDGSTP